MKRTLTTLTLVLAACSASTTPPGTVPLPPPPVVEPGVLPGIQISPVLLSEPKATEPIVTSTGTVSPTEPTTTTTTPSASPRPGTTTTTSTPAPAPAPTAEEPRGDTAAESEFVGLINDLRASRGLSPLKADADLRAYARTWSTHMASTGSFAHSDISTLLGTWSSVGENIASGAGVAVLFDALVASPGHLENMVNPDYSHVGVGVAVDAQGVLWVTQVFGG